jgi:hypothetical protein
MEGSKYPMLVTEHNDFWLIPNTLRVVESRRMEMAGHDALKGNQETDVTLTRRPEYKRPLGRLKAYMGG